MISGEDLFARIIHVRAQYSVDPSLPTPAVPSIGLNHLSVEAQRLIDLRTGLSRAPASARNRMSGLRAKDLANQREGGSRPFEISARPFGAILIGL